VPTGSAAEGPTPAGGAESPPVERLGVWIGGAVALDPGGLTPAWQIDVRLRWRPVAAFSVAARLWIPTAPVVVEAREGSSEQTLLFAGADVVWHPFPSASILALDLGVLGGVIWMRSSGTAAAGYVGRVEDVVFGAVGADATATVRLLGWLSLYLSGAVLVAMPRAVVAFAGRDVAEWGRPAVMLSLGFRVRLWEGS